MIQLFSFCNNKNMSKEEKCMTDGWQETKSVAMKGGGRENLSLGLEKIKVEQQGDTQQPQRRYQTFEDITFRKKPYKQQSTTHDLQVVQIQHRKDSSQMYDKQSMNSQEMAKTSLLQEYEQLVRQESLTSTKVKFVQQISKTQEHGVSAFDQDHFDYIREITAKIREKRMQKQRGKDKRSFSINDLDEGQSKILGSNLHDRPKQTQKGQGNYRSSSHQDGLKYKRHKCQPIFNVQTQELRNRLLICTKKVLINLQNQAKSAQMVPIKRRKSHVEVSRRLQMKRDIKLQKLKSSSKGRGQGQSINNLNSILVFNQRPSLPLQNPSLQTKQYKTINEDNKVEYLRKKLMTRIQNHRKEEMVNSGLVKTHSNKISKIEMVVLSDGLHNKQMKQSLQKVVSPKRQKIFNILKKIRQKGTLQQTNYLEEHQGSSYLNTLNSSFALKPRSRVKQSPLKVKEHKSRSKTEVTVPLIKLRTEKVVDLSLSINLFSKGKRTSQIAQLLCHQKEDLSPQSRLKR